VYFLPPIFFLGGAAILYSVLRRVRSAPVNTASGLEPVPNPAKNPQDPYLSKVEEELKKQK
jgi:hypothetical protein